MKDFMKKATISLLAIALLIFLFMGFASLIGVDFDEISDMNTIVLYLGMILIVYIPVLIAMFFFKFSFNLGKIVAKKEMTKIDFKKDKDYFRDILKNYGILELAYIHGDFEKLKKKDIIAVLLSLELNDVIKIEDNKIINIDRSKTTTSSEEYILNSGYSGKINITDTRYLTNMVKNEALNKGLLKRNTNIAHDIISMFLKMTAFAFGTGIATIIYTSIIFENFENIFVMLLGLVIILLNALSTYRFVYFISYVYHKVTNYELTDKGIEIKKKLNGLERFIKDFGDLDNDNKKTLEMWEDYLLYSVIFENNKLIEKNEYKNIVKIKNNKLSFKAWFVIFFIIAFYILLLF